MITAPQLYRLVTRRGIINAAMRKCRGVSHTSQKMDDDRHQTIFTIPLRWVRAYAMPPIAQPQSGCNLNNPMLTISEAQSATWG